MVELTIDLPEHGLFAGDRGTIVRVHTADAFEVEFIADGRTVGVLTLEADQLRRV